MFSKRNLSKCLFFVSCKRSGYRLDVLMSVLFLNGSPHKNGATVGLAKSMFGDRAYEELDLVDYKIYDYGQKFSDDQFGEVLSRMDDADTIVIGSPMYWHNLSGMIRNLLDRLYGALDRHRFNGKRLALLYQGAAPDPWMIEAGEYSVKMFCTLYDLTYLGMATNSREAWRLGERL